MSMRVERSSLDQVKKRFEVNKKKLEEKQKEYDFEERMKELREEVRREATPPGTGYALSVFIPDILKRADFWLQSKINMKIHQILQEIFDIIG